MKLWILPGLGLVTCLALVPSLNGQVPVAPAATSAAVPAAAPTRNLWSFLLPSADQKAKCRECLCNSPLGEMLKGAAGPVSGISGGLIPPLCGTPAQELANMTEDEKKGAAGTAAAIKKSEAEAKARREAVRYLGTVDCNYFPEAKGVLIKSLRKDPNECVRYEAALALGRGCCCNKDTMDALKYSANGSKEDGNPPECSWRVREQAAESLAHCAAIFKEVSGPGKATDGKKIDDQQKKPDTLPPPSASLRGKGLVGIFAAASSKPSQSPIGPPSARDPLDSPMISSAPAPRVPPIANLPFTSKNPYENNFIATQTRDNTTPTVPAADKNPAPAPAGLPNFGPETPVVAREANTPAAAILPMAAVAPKAKVLTLRLLPGATSNGNAAIPVTAPANTAAVGIDTRPAAGVVVPTHGTVIVEETR